MKLNEKHSNYQVARMNLLKENPLKLEVIKNTLHNKSLNVKDENKEYQELLEFKKDKS